MDIKTNFLKGRMNKSVDERILPLGEYRDALNVRLGSTEGSTIGALENTKGNSKITTLEYNGSSLSTDAVCIGAYEDGTQETLYWFVHDPTRGVDMVVSYNTNIQALNYHLISTSVLNFDPKFLITGVNLIDNFLFFTDDLNPPRRIDVTKQYPTSFIEGDISVLRPSPISSPTFALKNIAGQDDFMETRFISFAYRYKYSDGEYSALSQFSEAAFAPSPYEVNEEIYSNVGMLNSFNAADITINTGPASVIGIDLCFKQSNSNVINVIQKFTKEEEGWADNSTQVVEFSNSKVFTTLPESELLRLFDNVPLKAKAQTEMGNRIFYGNYVEGYNVTNPNGEPLLINYTTDLVSESVVSSDQIGSSVVSSGVSYNDGFTTQPFTVANDSAQFNFSNVTLQTGDIITIDLGFKFKARTSSPSYTDSSTFSTFRTSIQITVDGNYSSIYDFITNGSSFQAAIGSTTMQNTPNLCKGLTFGDKFGCDIPVPIDQFNQDNFQEKKWEKNGTFIGTAPNGSGTNNQSFNINSTSGQPNLVRLQSPAMMYVVAGGTDKLAFYVEVVNPIISYMKSDYNRTLHSNRDYELGLIYMDAEGRNSTVLTSETNTQFVPVSASDTRNYLKATINNLAPPWATRYKFALQVSQGSFETVYIKKSDIEVLGVTNTIFMLLEGENQTKFSVGDTLVCKVDGVGPLNNLVEVEVLDITIEAATGIFSKAGLYAKVVANNFSYTAGGDVDFLVFETRPSLVAEGVFYEGSQSFSITNRFHSGNVQTQTGSQPAIINLDFFNAYTFGNGVEGIKIEDLIAGSSVSIGSRTNSVSLEGYKQVRNASSLTYSGVYNPTSNVNKLNEFNLALANFKDLEIDFGSIQKLHARETDILCLQEDKISYVQAGKNLLSDAAGGGAITSVPEVLGKQIARIEEYGISLNPESFTAYGFDRYFTDAKRGAVLKLTGAGIKEKLEVISNYGMRSWFRDRFIESFDGQKLGGYDPYMNEYVLSVKDNEVDMPETIIPCGAQINANDAVVREFTVELGNVGASGNAFVLTYTIGVITSNITFTVIYNGVTTTSGAVTSSGTLSVPKTTKYPTQAVVKIIPAGNTDYELTIGCVS